MDGRTCMRHGGYTDFLKPNILEVVVTLIGSDTVFPLSSSTTLIAIDYGWSTWNTPRNSWPY